MPLIKLQEYYPNYKEEILGGDDIYGFEVFAGKTTQKIGIVCDDVIDLTGRFRYLVIDTSLWGISKKILLPVGSCRLDFTHERVYAIAITTKQDIAELPDYSGGITVDYDYQEPLYKAEQAPPALVVETSDQEQSQVVQLYAEKLTAHKERRQKGELVIGKRIKTETASISVPVYKDKIVIERNVREKAGEAINASEVKFCEGEVIRIQLYEEIADIRKEAFVCEEISIKKTIEQQIIEAQATLRREELEVSGEESGFFG
jgi:uncharacterized protein (TIGR02271 family)